MTSFSSKRDINNATQLLKQGCAGFLASLTAPSSVKLKIEDIMLVKEFMDVFPNDHLGLPQDREVILVQELHLYPRHLIA